VGESSLPWVYMVATTVLSYPIPPYSNVPIHPEFYQPRRWVIEAIELGQTTLVTTTTDLDYVIGQQVRFIIPYHYGIRELNEVSGYVISVPADDQVEIDIDSSHMNAFVDAGLPTKAQILAIGDVNTGQVNISGRVNQKTYIPGSFINISPL